MYVVYFIFLKCGNSLLPFGESPLMTLTSILENVELLNVGPNDSQVIYLQHDIPVIICLHRGSGIPELENRVKKPSYAL